VFAVAVSQAPPEVVVGVGMLKLTGPAVPLVKVTGLDVLTPGNALKVTVVVLGVSVPPPPVEPDVYEIVITASVTLDGLVACSVIVAVCVPVDNCPAWLPIAKISVGAGEKPVWFPFRLVTASQMGSPAV
jgi:hypothetical protein